MFQSGVKFDLTTKNTKVTKIGSKSFDLRGRRGEHKLCDFAPWRENLRARRGLRGEK
jgi:hypothetical protein